MAGSPPGAGWGQDLAPRRHLSPPPKPTSLFLTKKHLTHVLSGARHRKGFPSEQFYKMKNSAVGKSSSLHVLFGKITSLRSESVYAGSASPHGPKDCCYKPFYLQTRVQKQTRQGRHRDVQVKERLIFRCPLSGGSTFTPCGHQASHCSSLDIHPFMTLPVCSLQGAPATPLVTHSGLYQVLPPRQLRDPPGTCDLARPP